MRRAEDTMTIVMVVVITAILAVVLWEVLANGGLSPAAIRQAMP